MRQTLVLCDKSHPSISTLRSLKDINSYDIETYEENHRFFPFCVCFWLDNKPYSFYDKNVIIRSILKILTITQKSCIIYVHNLDFDGFLVLEEVSKYTKLKIDFLIDKMKIYYLRILFSGRIIEFRCSKKILPASLKSIAVDFNLPLKIDFPYEFISRDTLYYIGKLRYKTLVWDSINIMKYSIEYCSRDVEITRKFIDHLRKIFYEDQHVDILNNYTISGASLKTFSEKYNYRNVNLKLDKATDLCIREGYFGGRVEVFGNTEKKIYHYDFPGMYGLCMMEKFPISNPRWCSVDEVNLNNLLPGFYTIDWCSPNLRIPILPVKNEYGKLIFPNGSHSGTYWFEEINLFTKNGGKVLSIKRALVYDEYNYVFDKFVSYFNKFREKGGAYKILGKLIINSLYGKLGSGIKDKKYIVVYGEKEFEELRKNENVLTVTELNKIFIVEVKDKTRIKGLNVGLAAAITSKARIKLYNTMIEIEKKGGRMLYCDTDSVFVEFKDIVDESVVKWDKDDSIYDEGIFALPKTYALKKGEKEIVKIKGIPKNSVKFDNFKEKFYKNEILFFDEVFQTKKADFCIRSGNVHKRIDLSNYDKRVFDSEKNNTYV